METFGFVQSSTLFPFCIRLLVKKYYDVLHEILFDSYEYLSIKKKKVIKTLDISFSL